MATNPRLAGIAPSLIRAIAAKRRPTSIDLGLGEPALRPSIEPFTAAAAWVAQNGCPYTANAGDAMLRERIAKTYGYDDMTGAENVCITNGSQEALHSIFSSVLDPSCDEVLIVEPAFGSYAKLAELAGVTVQTVALEELDGFAFDAERILAGIDAHTRMLVLCSPCNPTGRVLDATQATVLADGLRARSGEPIIVLFDEVYRELTYRPDAVDFATYYMPTIIVNSLSKSNALTGLRLGWALGPEHLIALITKAHSWSTAAASTFAQRVALHIFSESGALSEHADWYDIRAGEIRGLLTKYAVRHAPIDGTFYAFIRLPKVTDSVAAAMALADEEDVLVIPGRAFGQSGEGWLRMSWVAPIEKIELGIERMTARFS